MSRTAAGERPQGVMDVRAVHTVRRGVAAVVVAVLGVALAVVVVVDLTGSPEKQAPTDAASSTKPTASKGATPTGTASSPAPAPSAPVDPSRIAAPPVLTPATGAAPSIDQVALDRVLAGKALGPDVRAMVVNVADGAVLLDRDAATARTPASVAKLATAAAVLSSWPAGQQFATRVVIGSTPDTLVLVGGGDASLSSVRTRVGDTPRRASLAALADQVARSRAAAATGGPAAIRLQVDDSLFTGPAVSRLWRSSYVAAGIVAPVSALSVDEGRVTPTAMARERDPALAAGRDLARLLTRRGLRVNGTVTRTTASATAPVLAQVWSPTVAELVELTLQTSDNDLAEALLRLAAIGSKQPATFAGGAATVTNTLTTLAVPVTGLRLLDGSGLARGDAVSARTLATLLRLAADGSHPELAPILEGLPVAGFSGTLADRFGTGPTRGAAGVARAKTGTLTGVSTLAGVTTVDGAPVVFVVLADRVPTAATLQARADLDRVVALLGSSSRP